MPPPIPSAFHNPIPAEHSPKMRPSMKTIFSLFFLLSSFLSPARSTPLFFPGTTIASFRPTTLHSTTAPSKISSAAHTTATNTKTASSTQAATTSTTTPNTKASNVNPFSAKAALVRYWSRKIPNNSPKPSFLLSKASPLSAADATLYESLAEKHSLTPRLRDFCGAANLVCFPDLSPSLDKNGSDANFAVYVNINFTNYGTGKLDGLDSFKNYSDNENVPLDTFRRYSRDSVGHKDKFSNYAPNGNVVTANFTSYGSGTTGGAGDFSSYDRFSNVPDLKFTNYDDDSNGRKQTFSSYSDDTNAGDQSFSGYGKHGNGVPTEFKSYGNNSNVIGSTFNGYGEDANVANDTFSSYGFDANVPENTFRSYGSGGNVPVETFSSYRDTSNVGDDNFISYGKGANAAEERFSNYGQSANIGSDNFKGYSGGVPGNNPTVSFKVYGTNNTFKDYAKTGVTFKTYRKPSSSAAISSVGEKKEEVAADGGKRVNRWVEPGKFFRESMLRTGTVMPMPDIRDKMPARSFLPRSISAKMPFSTARIDELNQVFNATLDTSMSKSMAQTIAECERAPSRGETKRCATSVEDMIDFAVSVLGNNIVVRSTASVRGSKGSIMIGGVHGINGGKVTKSVSCHQSLFPYMVYYCHSVPKVRVYEAEILDVGTHKVINHAVAICHIDTSDWSASHGAFVALGSSPGRIEVCHWIFEGDMTWAVAD